MILPGFVLLKLLGLDLLLVRLILILESAEVRETESGFYFLKEGVLDAVLGFRREESVELRS